MLNYSKVIAHHFGKTGKGMGQKCSDLETVPLCVSCHNFLHTSPIGNKRFQKHSGLRIKVKILRVENDNLKGKIYYMQRPK